MRKALAFIGLAITAIAPLLAASSAPAAATFTVTKAGTGATEPGINVADDGSIFVDGPAGTPGHSLLWRSTDNAATWKQQAFGPVASRLPGGGDSDVTTRGSRVFFLDLWLGSNSIAVSEDRGATWLAGTPLTTLPLSDRQWLALGPRDATTGMDTVYVLYSEVPGGVSIARSDSNGLAWNSHTFVPGSSGSTGQLISDGNKRLYFTAEDGGQIRGFLSEDGGLTWSTKPIAKNALGIISGAAMDGNNLYAAWISKPDYSAWVGVSHDLGATWTNTQVSAPDTSNVFAWIEARNGKVAMSWFGADAGAVAPDSTGTALWYVRYVESVDGGNAFTSQQDVSVARKDFICTRGLSCDPSLGGPGHRELGDFLTVTIDANGKSLIAFVATTSGAGVKVARQN